MNKLKTTLAIIALAILIAAAIVYAATLVTIPNDVDVENITTPASISASPNSLSWGTMSQGDSKTLNVVLSNTGESPTGNLSVTHGASVGTLTSNITGAVIAAGDSLTASFTLTITETGNTTDTFNIVISD